MKLLKLVSLSLFLSSIQAYALESFSYSGRLVHTNGSPVTGPVNLRFDISSTEDPSTILCYKSLTNVPLSQGIFNVKVDLLPSDCGNKSLIAIMDELTAGHSLSYQITDETNNRTYSPQEVFSVPLALVSQHAKSLGSMGATNDQVLKWNAVLNRWVPSSLSLTSGTITSIATGSGLSGGPITSSGTISIATGGVTNNHLAGDIEPSKLAGTRNASMYLRGDNTWATFADDIFAQVISDFNPVTGYSVGEDDTIQVGLEKLQGQINSLQSGKLDLTGGTLSIGTIDGVPTPISDNQVVNKKYVDDLISGGDNQWAENDGDVYRPNGNVGIGTSTPSSLLNVYDAIGGGVLALFEGNPTGGNEEVSIKVVNANSTAPANSNADMSTITAETLRLDNSRVGISMRMLGINYQGIYGVAREGVLDTTSNSAGLHLNNRSATGPTRISNNGSEHVRITSAGNVGIGVTNPVAKLDINGTIKISGGNPGVGKVLTSDGDGLASWTDPASTAPTGAAGGDLSGNYPNPSIGSGVISNSHISATAAIAQSKIDGLSSALSTINTNISGKQDADSDLTAIAGLTTTGLIARTGTGTATTVSLTGALNRVEVSNDNGTPQTLTINVSPSLLPSPVAADANRVLMATGANTSSWTSIDSSFITTALGFTPIDKAGDTISSGTFSFGSGAVLQVARTPTDANDVANKSYVDSQIGGVSAWSVDSVNNYVYRSNGNVGIGTSTPSTKLEIVDSDDAGFKYSMFSTYPANLRIFKGRGTSTAPSAVRLGDVLGGLQYYGYHNTSTPTTRSAAMEVVAAENFTGTAKGAEIVFRTTEVGMTSSPERLRISNAGNVGIGTSTPSSKLDIVDASDAGFKYSMFSTFPADLRIFKGRGTSATPAAVQAGDVLGGLQYFGYHNTSAPTTRSAAFEVVAAENFTATAKGADIVFRTTQMGSTTNSERLRISSTGNIGIGVIAPTAKLDVLGNVKIVDGTQGAGKVLTSDANGVASWQSPALATGSVETGSIVDGAITTAKINDGAVTTAKLADNSVTSAKIVDGTITNADISATAAIDRSKINGLTNLLPSPSASGQVLMSTSTTAASWTTPPFLSNTGASVISTSTYSFGSNVTFQVARTPTSNNDVVNKSYVDTAVSAASGPWTVSGSNINRSTGNVGIGVATPTEKLEVNGSVKATSFISTSDRRLKKEIERITGLDLILKLTGVRYQWIANDQSETGFIAQEVERVLPDAVVTDPHSGMKAIKYQNILAPLVEATKEIRQEQLQNKKQINRELASLKEENSQLKSRVEELESRLQRLEKLLHRD